MTHHTIMPSPLGNILLIGEERGLTGLHFQAVAKPAKPPVGSLPSQDFFAETVRQLNSYFQGSLKVFNLRLLMEGTDFQKKVWAALGAIPYGATLSYGELARRIGHPLAMRAVGGANGRNPIPIIIPCHRVINSDGKLGGYSCGLEIKKSLLDLEARYA
jgi:methylated-DNA-[protein]-cysteine S-methyltransferase